MTEIVETGYPATLETFNSTASDFVFEQTTSDPLSLFEMIKDHFILVDEASELENQGE